MMMRRRGRPFFDSQPEPTRRPRELTLAYQPGPSQQRFHDLPELYKGFSGPVGSGKSVALCYECLDLAYVNAGHDGLIGSFSIPNLNKVTRRTFLRILKEEGIPHRFFKQEKRCELPDVGSTVWFESLSDPDSLRGPNLAWFGVDELTYAPWDSWLQLCERLRLKEATRLCGAAAWTPRGHGAVHDAFIAGELGSDYACVRAVPGENAPNLKAGYYDALGRSLDERTFKQEVLGEYLNVYSGQVYYAFSRSEHVGLTGFNPNLPLLWSLDFNLRLGCSVLAQRDGDRLHVIAELALPGSTSDHCKAFVAWLDRLPPLRWPQTVYVFGDATGRNRDTAGGRSKWDVVKEHTAELGVKFSYRVPDSNPRELDRVTSANWALKDATGQSRILIDPKCTTLIRDLERVGWKVKPTEKGDRLIEQIDKLSDPLLTHMSDALGYLIAQEFKPRQKAQWGSGFIG